MLVPYSIALHCMDGRFALKPIINLDSEMITVIGIGRVVVVLLQPCSL